jgi:type VI protein secretion system component Hcp
MIPTRRLAAAVCGVLLVSAPALAADVVLELAGVEGEASPAPRTIDVQSWSWGVSNAGSMSPGPRGAGKVSVQDLSVTAPRDAASGLATGRRAAAPAASDASATAAPADAAAAVQEFTVVVPEAAAKSACATGKHIKSATLRSRSGSTVQFDDAVVTACTTSGGMSTVTMRGHTKSGHVTLLK